MERRVRIRAAFEPTRFSAERLRNVYESLLPVAERPLARNAMEAKREAPERDEQGPLAKEKYP
jgi:hypothetical protein